MLTLNHEPQLIIQDVRMSPGGYEIHLGLNLHNLVGKALVLNEKEHEDLNLVLLNDLFRKIQTSELTLKESMASDWAALLDDNLLDDVFLIALNQTGKTFSFHMPYVLFYLIHMETGKTKFTIPKDDLSELNANLHEMLSCEYFARQGLCKNVGKCSIFKSCDCYSQIGEPTDLRDVIVGDDKCN